MTQPPQMVDFFALLVQSALLLAYFVTESGALAAARNLLGCSAGRRAQVSVCLRKHGNSRLLANLPHFGGNTVFWASVVECESKVQRLWGQLSISVCGGKILQSANGALLPCEHVASIDQLCIACGRFGTS